MAALQFHTRDNGAPYDKAALYFTAHPEDLTDSLAEIEKDIFLMQDCVIWFDPDARRPMDEAFFRELELLHLQLMVIPVTQRLLTEPNRVTEAELDFARQHQIPVLPILMEQGLEPLYKTRFRDMQYLNRVTRDSTAIPYMERLEKFLDGTLVGDETMRQIRKVFDALIFLSYRKKDRALAQELMELIHRIPQLEAVGFWYDEFLVPGEGFNGGIRSALEESDLVVLTVTPNLVNEDNFIKKNEYKWARIDFDKTVLPAQMEQTDLAALRNSFRDIREPVDARDEGALQQALVQQLQDLLGKKPREPLHRYLLGLAYLHGIDTETDRRRGAELIRQAAQKGLLAAKEKLAQMYFYGTGVDRDFNASIHWQQQVVEAYGQQYAQAPDEASRRKYIWETVYLGDDLVRMARTDEAITAFETARKLFSPQDPLPYQERLLYTLKELALAYDRRDRLPEAIEALEEAVRVAEAATEVSPLLQQYHALALCDLGSLYQDAGRWEAALPRALEGQKLTEQLLDRDDSNETLHLLARVNYTLANLYGSCGNSLEAEKAFKTAIYSMGQVIKPIPTVDQLEFLIQCLCSAGQYYERQKKYDDAMALYAKAGEFAAVTGATAPTERQQQLQAQAQESRECLEIAANGQLGNKRPRFVKAADDRAAEAPTPENRLARADAHRSWAKSCSAGGNHEKAHSCFRKAISLYDGLQQETGRPEDICALCTARMDYAEALRLAQLWEPMPEQLSAVIELCDKALAEKDLPELRRELARAHTYRGRFYQHLEGSFYEAALDSFLEALPYWEQLVRETGHAHMRLFAAECKADVATCYLHLSMTENGEIACSYSRQAAEEMEALLRESSGEEVLQCAFKCLQTHAQALRFRQRTEEALPYFSKLEKLLPQLERSYEPAQYQYEEAMLRYCIGELTPGKQGLRQLKAAKGIAEALCKAHPFHRQYQELSALIAVTMKHR